MDEKALNEAVKAMDAANARVEEQRKKDSEFARIVAESGPAPGNQLTPQAQQLKDTASEMLTSGTNPSVVADHLRRQMAQNEARNQRRGRGR